MLPEGFRQQKWLGRALPFLLPFILTGLTGAGGAAASPPGEATNLAWCPGTSDCFQWDAAFPPGSYKVLRGTGASLAAIQDATLDSCTRAAFTTTSTGPLVAETPPVGTIYWYLVVAETCASPGPAGDGTFGPRVVNSSGDCAPPTCTDGIRDGTETDVDCGGICPACAVSQNCCAGADCASLSCPLSGDLGACAAPTCSDGIRNGSETDVDCGGGTCGPCGLGSGCLAAGDCASEVCQAGTCAVPSCTAGPGLPGGSGSTCGASGNTNWVFSMATTSTGVSLSDTDLYLSAGSRLSRLDPTTGLEANDQIFSGVILGRPLPIQLKGGLSTVVFIVGENGYGYDLNPITLATNWSRSLQRTGNASDSVKAAPAVQLWEKSDPAYRAARSTDLLIVGTFYPSTTANRVYGLMADTGTIGWEFNPTGSFQMDTVSGLVVDYARDLVYVVTDKHLTSTQNTVWALQTSPALASGARVWAWDLGAIDAEPVLANGGLFVGTREGVLYKLDPTTGTTIWQRTISTLQTITHLAADGENGVVYAVDSGGTLHAVSDQCGSAAGLWDFKPASGKVSAAPAILNDGWRYIYAGADDGRVWQVRASDGVAQAYATVSGSGAASSEEPMVFYDGFAPQLLARSGGLMKRFCIPWPDTAGDKAWLHLPRGSDPTAPADEPRIASGPGKSGILSGDRAGHPGATSRLGPRDR